MLVGLFLLVLAFAQEALDAHEQKLYQQPAWRPSVQTFSRLGILQIPVVMMVPYAAIVTFTSKLMALLLMLTAMSFNVVLVLLVALSVTVAKLSLRFPRPATSMDALKYVDDKSSIHATDHIQLNT